MQFNYKKFRGLLAENDITIMDFSKKIHSCHVTVADWRNGKSEPSIDQINRMAKILQVPESVLLITEINYEKNK